jgi:glucokinase
MTTLAADIGGTSIKLGLVREGRVLASDRLPVRERSSLGPLLAPLAQRWRELLARTGIAIDQVSDVALAFAGAADTRSRRIVSTNDKFTDGPSLDLCQWARDAFGLPLSIDNDARAALVGEWRAGAGRGVDDLVMLTLGTGIGAAAVIDGRVVRGSHGMAGMLGGHLTVDLHGRRCTCGNIGCAEAEASTHRLPEIVAAIAKFRGLDAAWRDAPSLNYALIFESASAGDPLAVAVRDHSLAVWSAAVVSLIHAFGPRRIVLGGGIVRGSPSIVATIQRYVDQYAWTPWGAVKVIGSELGDDAALIGCGHLQQESA